MKKILIILSILICAIYSQAQSNTVKGQGINGTNGVPTGMITATHLNTYTEFACDTTTGIEYVYLRDSAGGIWDKKGWPVYDWVHVGVPTHTPTDKQPYMLINSGDSVFHFRSGAWHLISGGGGGAGVTSNLIDLAGNIITSTINGTYTDTTVVIGQHSLTFGSDSLKSTTNGLNSNSVYLGAYMQTLSNTTGTLRLSGGGFWSIPDSSSTNEIQTITISAGKGTIGLTSVANIVLGDSSSVNEGALSESTTANEVQLLSNTLGSTTIFMDGRNGLIISDSSGHLLFTQASGGSGVTSNSITFSSDSLKTSVNGLNSNAVYLGAYLDNTDNQTIDTFTSATNTLTLSISGDGQAAKTASIINSNVIASSGNTFTSTINGIANSGTGTLINSASLTFSSDSIKATINGLNTNAIFTGDYIKASDSVTTNNLKTQAVTTAKLANNAVIGGKMTDSTVTQLQTNYTILQKGGNHSGGNYTIGTKDNYDFLINAHDTLIGAFSVHDAIRNGQLSIGTVNPLVIDFNGIKNTNTQSINIDATSAGTIDLIGISVFENYLSLVEQSAPGTPSSGRGRIYASSSDSHPHWIDDSGNDSDMLATGGGSPTYTTVGSGIIPNKTYAQVTYLDTFAVGYFGGNSYPALDGDSDRGILINRGHTYIAFSDSVDAERSIIDLSDDHLSFTHNTGTGNTFFQSTGIAASLQNYSGSDAGILSISNSGISYLGNTDGSLSAYYYSYNDSLVLDSRSIILYDRGGTGYGTNGQVWTSDGNLGRWVTPSGGSVTYTTVVSGNIPDNTVAQILKDRTFILGYVKDAPALGTNQDKAIVFNSDGIITVNDDSINNLQEYFILGSTDYIEGSVYGVNNGSTFTMDSTKFSLLVDDANSSTYVIGHGDSLYLQSNKIRLKSDSFFLSIGGYIAGYVLTANANGSATWQAASGGGGTTIDTFSRTTNTISLSLTGDGEAAHTLTVIGTVANSSSTNTLTTTINGVAGSGVNIINSNTLTMSSKNITSTLNGIATTPLYVGMMLDTATSFAGDVSGTYGALAIGSGKVTSTMILNGTVATADLADSSITAIKIISNAVTTTGINALAVITAKLADSSVTTLKIISNAVGTTALATGSVTTLKLADSSVTTIKLISNSVTATALATSAVTSLKILDGTIAAADIADSTITELKLATNSVGSNAIKGQAVGSAEIADSAITTLKIISNAVTAIGLATGSVTSLKILDGTISTADLANNSVDGTKIALGSDAQGDIMYYNGTDYVRLAPGTSGYFLKTNGASANPSWATYTLGATDTAYFIHQNLNAFGVPMIIGESDNFGITFKTNNITYARLDTSGNFKVGEVTPISISKSAISGATAGGLTITGGTAVGDSIIYKPTTANGTDAQGAHVFKVDNNGGTTAMTIRNSANIIVGGIEPYLNALLTINQAGTDRNFTCRSNLAKTSTTERTLFSLASNESTTPQELYFTSVGATAIADRYFHIYSSETGVAYGGGIVFQRDGGTVSVGTTAHTALFNIGQTATATGVLKGIVYTGAVNTNQTLSTEIPAVTFTTAGRQWATGALTTQREVLITQPTYSFVGASTITDAATLAIVGAPIKSTNATITNTYGLLIQAGAVSTATNSYGMVVNTQTGATNNYCAKFLGGDVAIGAVTPMALLQIAAGSATAGTAPICLTAGPLNTTAVAAQIEFDSSFYQTKMSGLRFANGGVIYSTSTDAQNSSTTETDLYSYTIPANGLGRLNETIEAHFAGTFNDVTATEAVRAYFAGTQLLDFSSAVGVGSWEVEITIIRVSSTQVRCSARLMVNNSTYDKSTYTAIGSLTLSNTNILKITGQSSGSGGGSNDVTATFGTIKWWGAAAN